LDLRRPRAALAAALAQQRELHAELAFFALDLD
jgi:hypothetical protein